MNRYNHLTEKDINTAENLNEVLEGLDDASKKTVLIYASGLRDRQMVSEETKTA